MTSMFNASALAIHLHALSQTCTFCFVMTAESDHRRDAMRRFYEAEAGKRADAKLKHEESEYIFKKDLMQRHLLKEIAEFDVGEDSGDEGDEGDGKEANELGDDETGGASSLPLPVIDPPAPRCDVCVVYKTATGGCYCTHKKDEVLQDRPHLTDKLCYECDIYIQVKNGECWCAGANLRRKWMVEKCFVKGDAAAAPAVSASGAGASSEQKALQGNKKRKAEDEPPLEAGHPSPLKKPKLSSSSEGSKRALVLGMAFVNQQHAADAESKVKVDTDSSKVRDRARLLALTEMDFDVLTMNMAQSEAECEPGRHCEASYGRRAAIKLTRMFGADGRPPLLLHSLMLDYFRFPGVYMRDAYASVFSEMIPALVERKVIAPETVVYIPNLKDLLPTPHSSLKYLLEWRPIAATEYPLFAATDKADGSKLGNYTNSESIKQLDAKFPFVAARFGQS
jgi:hypothetical protein